MSSIKYGNIQFFIYSNDHLPMHVNGCSENSVVIVELLLHSREVRLANRKGAIKPGNTKRSTVKKILDSAAEHFDDLVLLWEQIHGQS